MNRFWFFILSLISISTYAQEPKVWTLEECVNYAVEHNLSVKNSQLSIELQQTEIERAQSSFLPTASASTSLSTGFDSPLYNNTFEENKFLHSFGNNYNVSVNSTLYNGNRNKLALEGAKKELEINELNTNRIKSDLAVQVVSAYLNVLYNKEGVRIAQDQVKVGEQLLERMQVLVDAGVNARNDLYQAQANLATNEENLVTAQNNLEVALLDLAQLIQVPYKGFNIADVPVDVKQATMKYNSSDIIYNKALEWRPEILSAEKQIESADIQIETAKSGMKPTLTAGYSFGTNYGKNLELIATQEGFIDQLKNNRGHSLGATLSIPIFDQKNTRLNTQRAQIQKKISETNLENEKILLQADIERAYLDAVTSLKTLDAAKKTVDAQEEAYRTAQERYDLGILTSYDFEQVRNQLVQAQSSYIRAKYNYLFKTKFLEIYYGLPVTL
jgi:outer membrane protein